MFRCSVYVTLMLYGGASEIFLVKSWLCAAGKSHKEPWDLTFWTNIEAELCVQLACNKTMDQINFTLRDKQISFHQPLYLKQRDKVSYESDVLLVVHNFYLRSIYIWKKTPRSSVRKVPLRARDAPAVLLWFSLSKSGDMGWKLSALF